MVTGEAGEEGEKTLGGGLALMIPYWLCLARCCLGFLSLRKGACLGMREQDTP